MGQDLQGIISHLHAQWVISPCIRASIPSVSVVSLRIRAHGIADFASVLIRILDAGVTFRAFEPRKDALTFYPFQIRTAYRACLYDNLPGYSTVNYDGGSFGSWGFVGHLFSSPLSLMHSSFGK